MTLKTMNVGLADPSFVHRLLENAASLQRSNVILDHRQFGNGVQLLYMEDEPGQNKNKNKRNTIEEGLYKDIAIQLIFS